MVEMVYETVVGWEETYALANLLADLSIPSSSPLIMICSVTSVVVAPPMFPGAQASDSR